MIDQPSHEIVTALTNVTAGAALVSPWWLSNLAEVSQGAAVLLPILGCAWLVTQIGTKLFSTLHKDKD